MTTNSGLYVPHGIVSPIVSPVPQHQHHEDCLLRREKIPDLHDDRFYTSQAEDSEKNACADEECTENGGSEEKRTIHINKNMLIYKAFYFLFYGAVGSLFPYLAVFYKQLYLSAQQVGFLIGVRPFIQMGAVPLWGALADTYNVKKIILIMSILAWLATNYSISIVRTPPEMACNITADAALLRLAEMGKIAGEETPHVVARKNMSLITFLYNKHLSSNNTIKRRDVTEQYLSNGTSVRLNFSDRVVPNKTLKVTRINEKLKEKIRREKRSSDLDIVSDMLSYIFDGSVEKRRIRSDNESNIHRMMAADELESEFDSINTDDEYPWPLDSIEERPNKKEIEEARKDSSKIFAVLIVITLIGTLIASPAATLADTATLENLGSKTYLYGFQRLWGAFGWGLCAFVVGAVVSGIQNIHCTEGRHVDYILSFYVYAAMMALACIVAFFFKFAPLEEQAPSYTESLWEAVKLFSDVQHALFVVTLLVSGASMGFIHTFLFWHLHDLGGTQFLFSVISGVQCVSEVLMYLVSGYLMLHIGCENVFYIGLTANVVRLFAYSVINQPVCSIALEVLQGVSSASIWTAAVCYIGLIPGTPVTLQALLHAIYWGLGHGGGGILGGVLVTYIGSHITFVIYGCICFLNLLILVLLKYWAKIVNLLGNYTYVENIPSGTYILTQHHRTEPNE